MAGPRDLLLVSMPFADVDIPSIQLAVLAAYLRQDGCEVDARHFYLWAADALGLDAYRRQVRGGDGNRLLYGSLLFPDHYQSNEAAFRLSWSELTAWSDDTEPLGWDEAQRRLKSFHERLLAEIDACDYRVLGLTASYAQLLPSLWLAKVLKARNPELVVVLGGAELAGAMGKNVLEAFSDVDLVVHGEGERILREIVRAAREARRPGPMAGLLSRQEGESAVAVEPLDLDVLPTPDHSDFFEQLERCGDEFASDVSSEVIVPIEGSRGCFWRRCVFCTLHLSWPEYRGRSPERIAAQIDDLVRRHRRLSFCFVDCVIVPERFRRLVDLLADHGRDYWFFTEARAGQLTTEDFAAMKQAGQWGVQFGIESFSPRALARMRKGVSVLQNVEALRLSLENDIDANYNLLREFPDEDAQEYEETLALIPTCCHLPPPAHYGRFQLQYGSEIYDHPREHNVAAMHPDVESRLVFPPPLLARLTLPRYEFDVASPAKRLTREVADAIGEWRKAWAGGAPPRLSYRDGGDFLNIHDSRDPGERAMYELDATQRRVYLACRCIRTAEQISRLVPDLSASRLARILGLLVSSGIVLESDGKYLAIAVPERTLSNLRRSQ